MRRFLFAVLIFAFGCSAYVKPSNEETGRVARYFNMNEKKVRQLYAKNNFSWDDTIKEIIRKSLPGNSTDEDLSSRIDGEVEKIKTECFLR